jgi:RNA polymerase sigma factor (sigma-70 family)
VQGALSDVQLLERFATGHPEVAEAAFETLVGRHGPMVLRVCRVALADPHDADDAFQATFMALVRDPASIRARDSISAWLHGVARRVASRARVEAARRRRLEARGARPEMACHADEGGADLTWLIQEELARLPAKYRSPMVLCYLEGLTHERAAERLGWPVGTVRGRLARARDILRTRLIRRGVTGTAALAALEAAAGSAEAAIPQVLREMTLAAAMRIAAGQALPAAAGARVASWVRTATGHARLGVLNRLAGVAAVGIGLAAAAMAMRDQAPPATPLAPPASQEVRSAKLRAMLQLKGTWASTQKYITTINGVVQPEKDYKLIWSIDRERLTMTGPDGFAVQTYRFSIDPDQSPPTIDFTSLNTGATARGIYKCEGDTLTVCYGRERPRGFEESTSQVRIVFHRESRSPAQLAPELPNAPGCYWTMEPEGGIPSSMHNGGVSLIIRKDPQGAMVVILASQAKVEGSGPDAEHRPVAFDDEKVRHLFDRREGGWSGSFVHPGTLLSLYEYRLDPDELPFDRVRRLGIEVVPAEIRREEEAAARVRVFREAAAAGIELLPRPEVGKPLEFALTVSDGRALRSAELKGKVVLIACWASWSGPCTEMLTRLKTLYETHRGRGLEIVGLNFDQNKTFGERLVKSLALSWPQVYVPPDERTRRLWKDGPGLPTYPRLLILDRDGILRHDGGPEVVERYLARALGGGAK